MLGWLPGYLKVVLNALLGISRLFWWSPEGQNSSLCVLVPEYYFVPALSVRLLFTHFVTFKI